MATCSLPDIPGNNNCVPFRPGRSASPWSLHDLMPPSWVVGPGVCTWDRRGCQISLFPVTETGRCENGGCAGSFHVEIRAMVRRKSCCEVCGHMQSWEGHGHHVGDGHSGLTH